MTEHSNRTRPEMSKILDSGHGGWQWSLVEKQQFSQDPANHVASRACVNQSKGGDDIYEWSDASIASSSACGGGYTVTTAGRCFLARTTLAVKTAWALTVDRDEADALSNTLAECGDQTLEVSAVPQESTTTAVAAAVVAAEGECVISGRSAAEFDAVYGIGEVLAPRLAAVQPFASIADLDAVSGIGPVKSGAVWDHFCSESASASSTASQETPTDTAAPTTAPPTTAPPTTAPPTTAPPTTAPPTTAAPTTAAPTTAPPTTAAPTTAAPRQGCTHWHAGNPKHTHYRGGPHTHTHAPSSSTKCGWIFQ